jgi:hypothetical protein
MKYKYVTFNIGQNKSAINWSFLNSLFTPELDVLVIGLQEVSGNHLSIIENSITHYVETTKTEYNSFFFNSSKWDLGTQFRLMLSIIYKTKHKIGYKETDFKVYRMTKDGIFNEKAEGITQKAQSALASTKGIIVCNLTIEDKKHIFMTCHMPVSVSKSTSKINHNSIRSYMDKIQEILKSHNNIYMTLIGGDFNSRFIKYNLNASGLPLFTDKHFDAHSVICNIQTGGKRTKSKRTKSKRKISKRKTSKRKTSKRKISKKKTSKRKTSKRKTSKRRKISTGGGRIIDLLPRRKVKDVSLLSNNNSMSITSNDSDMSLIEDEVDSPNCIPSSPSIKENLSIKLEKLKEHDLLLNYTKYVKYTDFMSEPEIKFLPTYKLDTKNQGSYISNKPLGYADRVFIGNFEITLDKVNNISYEPLYIYGEENGSDHLPLVLSFDI